MKLAQDTEAELRFGLGRKRIMNLYIWHGRGGYAKPYQVWPPSPEPQRTSLIYTPFCPQIRGLEMNFERSGILRASVIRPCSLWAFLTRDTPSPSLSQSAVENPLLRSLPRIKDHRSTQWCLPSHWTLYKRSESEYLFAIV